MISCIIHPKGYTVFKTGIFLKFYLLFAYVIISISVSAQTIGLYMRDFEGTSCNSTYGYCTGDDDGRVPSCGTSCPSGTSCSLWQSNDIWLDTDDGTGNPNGATSYSKGSNGNCPELYKTTPEGQKNFIAVRILINDDFYDVSFGTTGNYTYHLQVSLVTASAGISLNHFAVIASTDITFSRTTELVGGVVKPTITLPLVAAAGSKRGALSGLRGLSKGFVVFLPWTAPGTGGADVHSCLLAELSKVSGTGTFDPVPIRAINSPCVTDDPVTTNSGYWQYVDCNDNVVWRNIDILGAAPPRVAGEGGRMETGMDIVATNAAGVRTTIQVEIPDIKGISLGRFYTAALDWSALPKDLQPNKDSMAILNEYLRGKWDGNFANIPLEKKLVLPNMSLPPGGKIPMKLNFIPVRNVDTTNKMPHFMVNVMQYEEEKGKKLHLVGGNSVMLVYKPTVKPGPGPEPKPCTGIKCWLDKNKWAYIIAGILILLILWFLFRRKK